jgi:hypothetical protein
MAASWTSTRSISAATATAGSDSTSIPDV